MDRDIIKPRVLQRLFKVAKRDADQCRFIARFLLGLCNGRRFPFDLTDLRGLDDELFEDCMAVLRMDARVKRQEVHLYVEGTGKAFEQLATDWGVEDMEHVRADAKRAAQPEGTLAPLHDGGMFQATLHTYGDAPATGTCPSTPGSAKRATPRSSCRTCLKPTTSISKRSAATRRTSRIAATPPRSGRLPRLAAPRPRVPCAERRPGHEPVPSAIVKNDLAVPQTEEGARLWAMKSFCDAPSAPPLAPSTPQPAKGRC